jgi:sortase A
MGSKILIRYIIATASIGIIIFSVLYVHSQKSNSKISVQENKEFPLRLRIPSLHVDAPVEYVGLTKDGEMDVPKNPSDVAWFKLGSHPGQVGSSVIAGHSGYKDNTKAVFDNLSTLKKGERIYIENNEGITITFVVKGFRTYAYNEDATSVFSSHDGIAHLNLITCIGNWDYSEKTHSNRLVVFTDRE